MIETTEHERACCSRCGAIVDCDYAPGRCFDKQGEPQEFDAHDVAESEYVVWGVEGAPRP